MNKTSKCPWIRVEDFVETSIWVSFENSTTETFLRPDERLEVAELLDAGITLMLPRRCCSIGHIITISLGSRVMTPFEPENSVRITEDLRATAKVIEVEPAEDGYQFITLRFLQFPESKWQQFLDLANQRQQAINSRVRRIQG